MNHEAAGVRVEPVGVRAAVIERAAVSVIRPLGRGRLVRRFRRRIAGGRSDRIIANGTRAAADRGGARGGREHERILVDDGGRRDDERRGRAVSRGNADHAVAIQILLKTRLQRLQRRAAGRYGADRIDDVLASIERTGYALTLGIHSRIDDMVEAVIDRLAVGNVYVNRNIIGAVVGVQPFGGFGLSGTGPKAGGPHYLSRFATEQTVTINTAAAGGNAALLSGEE